MRLPNIFEKEIPTVAYPAGATIFAAGQSGDSMFLVQSGEVDLRVGLHTVETVAAEGFFGEMALLEEGTRSADAVARTDCTLVPINQRQFLFMVGETPFFALEMLRTLSMRLRKADAEHR